MKWRALLLTLLAMCCGTVLAAGRSGVPVLQVQPVAGMPGETDRRLIAGRILLKWGEYVEKVDKHDRRKWAAALWPSLAQADLVNLQKALQAVTYEGMHNALHGRRPDDAQIIDRLARGSGSSSMRPFNAKSLGHPSMDLVFNPITPCRIMDTRASGQSPLAANETRWVDAANVADNFRAQGGDSVNCGLPTSPVALAISVTALNNTTTGYLRVFPGYGISTDGSPVSLNVINTAVNNDIIVGACPATSCTQELKVYSTARTHVAMFVTGYFISPQMTRLDCADIRGEFSVRTADYAQAHIACPARWTATGGGCSADFPGGRIIYDEPGITESDNTTTSLSTWFCGAENNDAVLRNVRISARCCRVPGREWGSD